jgi:hypothetical protein
MGTRRLSGNNPPMVTMGQQRTENPLQACDAGRNSRYRNADILVRLELANTVEADKNVRAPVVFLHSRRKP